MLGGIEAGGTKIVCATVRDGADIAARRFADRTVIATTTPDETIAAIGAFLDRFAPLSTIGVASFGPVDVDPASPRYGVIGNTPKPGWKDFCWQAGLARFACPVSVDTDVNAAARAELAVANGAPLSSLAYVTVGTGIGVGVARGGAPAPINYELGHLRIRHDRARDPFAGSCPYHGDCLEGLASGTAIGARWGAPLDTLPEGAADLIADYLAELVAAIALAHAPDRIVLGGGVMNAGLRDKIASRAAALNNGYVAAPAISAPALGENSGVTGALLLANDASQKRRQGLQK